MASTSLASTCDDFNNDIFLFLWADIVYLYKKTFPFLYFL